MQLRNHIAYRFLTDITFTDEIMGTHQPEAWNKVLELGFENADEESQFKVANLYHVASPHDQKAYYITDTVIDKLNMLRVSSYDYSVFKHIQDCKYTFIFKDNSLLRMVIKSTVILFLYIRYEYYPKNLQTEYKTQGTAHFLNFFVDRDKNIKCEHFEHDDVKNIEKLIYHLLCFFFLSENTEIVVKAGKSHGTKKQADALSNDLNIPVTIVNSNWNVTSIRNEGFGVSGHFRLQPCGIQNQERKMIFIEPFQKNGYVRKATNFNQ